MIIVRMLTMKDGKRSLLVLDPQTEKAGAVIISLDEFFARWSGLLVRCGLPSKPETSHRAFGLRWFIPEILRYKTYLWKVALAATMCNLISFLTPLLYHVIIDKAIPHQGYNTLFFVIAIFGVITVFEGLFSYMRQYFMLFATNKIDVNLASKTFSHLMGLPLQFFERTPVGILARHLQQTEKVRHFLTGRLFHTTLDTAALPILLALLLVYSVKLTGIVLLFSAAIAGIIGLMIPTFRYYLNQLYSAEGARQAHLVETLSGVRTIKSLCIEDAQQKAWDEKVVSAVRRQAKVGRIAAVANVATSAIDKMMQIAVLGVGATDVFDGELSIGALVAFTMLSARVSGPLIQIVALINEYQETVLSVRMLGTIMEHEGERDTMASTIRPPISGAIDFDNVSFSYPGAATPALDRVSFGISEGQIIGVVGRSGSGKTTITRLIQRIHIPNEGLIRLNGVDFRHIELNHLRRNVGIVLQDSFLFRGTIAQNIAAARPRAPLSEIVAAAKLAGADEFIERLPLSYDTLLEEGASNLSGGQKQRLAIARTLILRPRLLIFDEATSALDPESEAIIQQNLKEIARNRTMIIVSHRLSTLTGADAILVLDRGKVVDFAPHHTLLNRCQIYSHLWHQQTRHTVQQTLQESLFSAYGT